MVYSNDWRTNVNSVPRLATHFKDFLLRIMGKLWKPFKCGRNWLVSNCALWQISFQLSNNFKASSLHYIPSCKPSGMDIPRIQWVTFILCFLSHWHFPNCLSYSPWGHKELDTTEWLTLSLYIYYFIFH